MFGGTSNNPYDDIVVKTTDEHLTSENWELILNLCDKVQDEGSEGAHNVVAALLKRLTHRNPNVQLYTLSVAEALGKNCGIDLWRELASRAWTAGLERVVTDRNTHDKVRTRALALIAQWTADFADDSTLGIMGECYDGLKAKNYKYTRPDTPPPPAVDDAIRRREEEELQRVLEMSVRDRGGRVPYAFELDDGGGAGSSSSGAAGAGAANGVGGSSAGAYGASSSSGGYAGGYAPSPTVAQQQREQTPSPVAVASGPAVDASMIPDGAIVTRVRALHPFTPTEAGELGFEKGDVIKVVDRGYKDWWRGQLRGRTGIFPVNYVEPLPEPTPAELAAEATQEAAVFAQAVNVERLLNMLRALDPSKGDNLADDEEIQELYRSCMALRPKIVKLIDKYSQKRADLVSMNETFVRARTIFDRMMEESLARHSGGAVPGPYYPQPQPYGAPAPTPGPGPSGGAWGGYPDAAAYAYAQQQQAQQGQAQQGQGQGQGQQGQAGYGAYGVQGPTPYPAQAQGQQPQTQAQAQAQAAAYQQPQQAQQGPTPYPAQQQQQPQAQAQQGQGQGPTPYPAQQQQGPTPYPAQQPQAQPQAQAATVYQQQAQPQPAAQQAQAQPFEQQQQQPAVQQQAQVQAQPEPQQQAAAARPAQQQQAGPPYIYDPHTTYADPNVQAWAQYYAAGGKDLAGSVYFVSVPGVTEPVAAPAPAPAPAAAAQQQQGVVEQQQAQVAQHRNSLGSQQQQQQQAQAQVAQQQHRNSLGPTTTTTGGSPIDDVDDPGPGYFPDPYANQPEYATPAPAVAGYASAGSGASGSELAHALGPQPQVQPQIQPQYQGYALTDPGGGAGSAQRGYSLTDPGSGAANAAPVPSSPTSRGQGAGAGAAYGVGAGAGAGLGFGTEPAVAASTSTTPSWVLPKKTPNPNARSPQPQPAAGALAGQFAGMHV